MRYLPFTSYRLWQESRPSAEQLFFHCEMRRGYSRFRKKEPEVAQILSQDTPAQSVGLLAQRAVWEFHQDPSLFSAANAYEIIAERIGLVFYGEEIKQRLQSIIQSYQNQPVLINKKELFLQRGDEGFAQPIKIIYASFEFNLFVSLDCHFQEDDNTIHILDFKTGQTKPDPRQAYVYLLAAQTLFPSQNAIASFYNLETLEWTEPITASRDYLECIMIELMDLAKRNQQERQLYQKKQIPFAQLFPPNPGKRCLNCSFKSICEYAYSNVHLNEV